jgi:hypothetical protein
VTLPETAAGRLLEGMPMDLVQSRIVTDEVARLAAFYASLVRVSVVLNDYYVEVPLHRAEIMLDFRDPAGNLVSVSSPAD